ncbi:hypothetical protein E2320_015805 [Naja naja]|nr:hypothetical protein E2320_015805 [Naja naja]
MSIKVTLYELADLSIGTPEVGVINFNALHALLHAVISYLNIQDIKADVKMDRGPPTKPEVAEPSDLLGQEALPKEKEDKEGTLRKEPDSRLADLEKKLKLMDTNLRGVKGQIKGIEGQVQGVLGQVQEVENQVSGVQNQIHGIQDEVQEVQDQTHGVQDKVKRMGKDLIGVEKQIAGLEKLPSGTELLEKTQSGSGTAVSDMWQMMQMQKKIEASENGINQAMSLLQDLVDETSNMKSATSNLEDEVKKIKEHLAVLDPRGFDDRLNVCLSDQSSLDHDLKDLERRLNQFPSPEEMVRTQVQSNTLQLVQPHQKAKLWHLHKLLSLALLLLPREQKEARSHQLDYQGLRQEHQGLQVEQLSLEYSQALLRFQDHLDLSLQHLGRYAETLDALRSLSQLNDLYQTLRDQIAMLDYYKCGHSDLRRLQDFLTDALYKTFATIPPNLSEKLDAMRSLEEDFKSEKEVLRKIQNAIEGELPGEEVEKMEGANQITFQIGYLRATVHDIEKELKELRQKQDMGKAKLEQSMTDNAYYLQEQLDKLRSVIENMMSSSSTLLSMSMPPIPESGVAQVQSTCAACSLDVSEKVSQLFKRYEQLQDSVNNFMLRQAESKTKKPKQRQDEEVLNQIQCTILQVQEDCEKLNATTGNLVEDHHQKQKEISALYKSLEKLENEKVDKDCLETEIHVKADKTALAAKVSRTQFDATTEQLHKMMQELLNKMVGQEQDWQKMLDKLLIEMDSKLDRLELDPFRQQLEDRWKDIRKQLKQRVPQDEGDEAAGIRRRLLAHFHCISCDRPLEMVVPGPRITTLPAVPGLPAHQSLRPYMVYEMEQIRQLNRNNLKLGSGVRFDALEKSASLNKLRRIHSKMLMDIQKVQSHYGGAARVNAQMIREALQSQYLGSSPFGKRERLPEMADISYMSVPRHCGGSHTLTHPFRRSVKLQQLSQSMPSVQPDESTMLAMMKHEEVDILGLDGHIYKGRMDTHLPSITGKEYVPRTRSKLARSSSQRQHPIFNDLANLPARPHTAKVSVGSTSAKSITDKSASPLRNSEESGNLERETFEVRMTISSRQRSDEQST